MNDHQRLRISYHEAGHALVASHEGFAVRGVTVRRTGGSAEYDARLPDVPLARYASSRLLILLAGAVSQCTMLAPDDPEALLRAFGCEDASDDWSKAREVVNLIAHHRTMGGIREEAAMQKVVDDLTSEHFAQVERIIGANRCVLVEMAGAVRRTFEELFAFGPRDVEAPRELVVTVDRLMPSLGIVRAPWRSGLPA